MKNLMHTKLMSENAPFSRYNIRTKLFINSQLSAQPMTRSNDTKENKTCAFCPNFVLIILYPQQKGTET